MSALRIQELTKRYGRTVAVRGVTLEVARGQVFGLVGPNGSGKTTTLGCALGLLRPDGGRIEVLGEPAGRIERTRGRVGVVFDQPTLVPGLGVRENLEYARRLLGHVGGRSSDEALALTGIEELAGRRAHRLSLGQGRRLAIARALLGTPELLVLDEPLSGLDTPGVRSMLRLFARLAGEGLTLVLSSHRLHEMERVVSHVGIMLGGRLVRSGALDELLGRQAGRLEIHVDDPARAREVLGRVHGVGSRGADETSPGVLSVVLDGSTPEAVNRALVEGGCGVSALVPEHRSLQRVFEAILDEHLDGEPP